MSSAAVVIGALRVNTCDTTCICRKADSTSRVRQWFRHGCSGLVYRHFCFKGKMEEKERNKMRWPGVAQRSDKSDIDVKHLSHLADTIARKIFFPIRIFQLRTTFCVSDKEPYETFSFTLFY